MTGNTQMNNNERGLFSFIHGMTGYLVTIVLFLSVVVILIICSIDTQRDNATTYYEVNQDLNALKFKSLDNINYRIIK
jgi:succinate dehydrogenase/fumarate reductase cytochrome b subunit